MARWEVCDGMLGMKGGLGLGVAEERYSNAVTESVVAGNRGGNE